MKMRSFVILFVFGAVLRATSAGATCPETSFSYLREHLREFYKQNPTCFDSIFGARVELVKSKPTFETLGEYLRIACRIKGSAAWAEWFAEGFEAAVLEHTKLTLDAMASLEDDELMPLVKFYLKTPIYNDYSEIAQTIGKYRDQKKYARLFKLVDAK